MGIVSISCTFSHLLWLSESSDHLLGVGRLGKQGICTCWFFTPVLILLSGITQLSCFCSVFRPVCRWHLQGRFHSYPRLRACSLLLLKFTCTLFISPSHLPRTAPLFTCPYSFLARTKKTKQKQPSGHLIREAIQASGGEFLRNTFLLFWMEAA